MHKKPFKYQSFQGFFEVCKKRIIQLIICEKKVKNVLFIAFYVTV